jgi:glycosyltransferase involved in cell wall biosynthesis
LFAEADIVLCPSDIGSLPNALALLMYLGMPAIVGHSSEYAFLPLQHGANCYVVPAGDPGEWSSCLEDFRARSTSRRNIMSICAHHAINDTHHVRSVARHYLAHVLKTLHQVRHDDAV